MTFNREIPVYKPSGKKSYFKRQDLVDYQTRNRVSSSEEIERQALNYLTGSKKDRLRWS